MNEKTSSRRNALKQLVGLTALGAINTLRTSPVQAASTSRLSIPGVSGKVIQRTDSDYELWRQSMVWHLSKPSRKPDVIVQAKSTDDIVSAVKYAAQEKLKVAVRAGGHNSNGPSLRDDGLLLDLSALTQIQIDADARIASIQPGVKSLGLIQAARKENLMFPAPHCSSVGMSGFTMGGGIGWNYHQQGGMATHSIAGAEIVLADGSIVNASPDENPDLFWAVRGVGPGFFGVVSRLDLKLNPSPETRMASSYILPLSELDTVTTTMAELRSAGATDPVEPLVVLLHHPEMPDDAPPEESKICFITLFAFEDSEEAAKNALKPFAESALAGPKALAKHEYQTYSFEELYDTYFSLNVPAGRCARYAVDNVLTDQGAEALHALADHFYKAPSRDSHILAAFNMGTQVVDDSCFSWKADTFVGCYAIWDNEKDDARSFSWLEETLPLMDPFAIGHYVNEVETRKNPKRYEACFTKANWERLQQLRQKYDPAGVFHSYLGHS